MDIAALYRIYLQHPHVATDTRKLTRGSLFFALKGSNFNGNQFAKQALEMGAAYAIIDEPIDSSDARLIQVNNALETLQQLAGFHRKQLKIPVLAITGSNGKTTTTRLIAHLLGADNKMVGFTTSDGVYLNNKIPKGNNN